MMWLTSKSRGGHDRPRLRGGTALPCPRFATHALAHPISAPVCAKQKLTSFSLPQNEDLRAATYSALEYGLFSKLGSLLGVPFVIRVPYYIWHLDGTLL